MTFKTDSGGFNFSCDDAKFSFGASTWSTRLSQLGKTVGNVFVMTNLLPDIEYISNIISKRPTNIFIIANKSAYADAKALKLKFPSIKIALHPTNNAKLGLIYPDTVWLSSSDFGKSTQLETGIGFHSNELFQQTLSSIFEKTWNESQEI